jgi:diacylglycerol kinase (ATP)
MADGKTTLAPRGPIGVWRALLWSLQGIVTAFRTESSFRLEAYLFLVFGPLAVWLGRTPIERTILLGSLLLVLAIELLNSALEAIVDKVSPEFHEFAGRAKDMGSAAVFVSMLNVIACWAMILLPRLP